MSVEVDQAGSDELPARVDGLYRTIAGDVLRNVRDLPVGEGHVADAVDTLGGINDVAAGYNQVVFRCHGARDYRYVRS